MASQGLQTENMCSIQEDVGKRLKDFKFSKSKNARAIILKVNMSEETVEIEDELDDITTEELMEELPERQPRYIIYSYVHETSDGRVMYPLYFIYFKPTGCKPEQVMRYAGCRDELYNLSGAGKMLSLDEKENLTDEWVRAQGGLK
ncbi:glia maturation factor beta-like [Styela clava]